MRRAMELAGLGLGSVSPNPLVGCVIVHNERIIGEGWHKKFGEPHAEVNAVSSVVDATHLPASTVYVNLEPCAHFGKTPPCADLLIEKKVRRVVISGRDPNPLVAGKGIERMRTAGIEIVEGVLGREGHWLNRRFFVWMEQNIPYVILKWAESADRKMAIPSKQLWISNAHSRQRVHQWRTQEDAVLVGSRTAETDNPRLNVRDWTGKNPVRIVIDPSMRLHDSLRLFDGSQLTLRYNKTISESQPNIEKVNVGGEDLIHSILKDLYNRKIGSIIVEGGAETLARFINAGYWHEARVFQSGKTLGDGVAAPGISGKVVSEDDSTGDLLTVMINPQLVKTG